MGDILVLGVGGVEATGVLAIEEEEDVCMTGGGDLSSDGGDLLSTSGGGDLSILLLLGVDRKGAGVAVGTGLGVEVWGKGGGKYYCNDDAKWYSICVRSRNTLHNYTTIK